MNDDRPAPSDQNEGFGWFCPLPSGFGPRGSSSEDRAMKTSECVFSAIPV